MGEAILTCSALRAEPWRGRDRTNYALLAGGGALERAGDTDTRGRRQKHTKAVSTRYGPAPHAAFLTLRRNLLEGAETDGREQPAPCDAAKGGGVLQREAVGGGPLGGSLGGDPGIAKGGAMHSAACLGVGGSDWVGGGVAPSQGPRQSGGWGWDPDWALGFWAGQDPDWAP